MDHLTIFDELYPKFKITKPIRLIEFFGGYGSQALALKYLGVNFEHWKLCEWAVKSIQAYKDIHFPNGYHPAGVLDIPKEEIIDFLYKKGISSNYNEPMTLEQIKRLKEEQLYTIYENIYVTNNLVNIQQVKGKDLEIEDKDKYDYILTYSFPCQDLSLAGKGKGMSDTSTRSGMLWEVERILKELKETDSLPQVLLMENVPMIHSADNTPDFNKWQLELTKLGYKNYWEDLIATDYGIPQTRNRCFMVSILGDYNYSFPRPIKLEKRLKDMLEDNVEEKYFLSDKMMEYITSTNDKYKVNENNLVINREIACSKTTREGWTRADTTDYICNELPENYNIKNGCKQIGYIEKGTGQHQSNTIYDGEKISPCLNASDTLLASGHHNTLIVKDKTPKVIGGVGEKKSNSGTQWYQQDRIYNDNVAISITTECNPYYKNNLRIRKLTPKECFRLMGVKDTDFEKCAKNQSDSSLYHLAGDSIVVNVLMAIFKEML